MAADPTAALKPGPINLDALSDEELYQFIRATRGVRPRRAANRLFPDQPGAIRAVKDLNCYAWNAITARSCRRLGKIQTAQGYEAICQRIYDELPEYAKW